MLDYFLYAWVLLLLFALPLGWLAFMWAERVRQQRLARLGDVLLVGRLVQGLSVTRRRIKQGLWLVAVGFLVVALARPVWGQQVNIIETEGVSVFVLLDVSTSMNAEDVLPSRLVRAKLSIGDLLTQIGGNEVGLIAFAGSAFVVSPLTTDSETVLTFLNYITTDTISRRGTAIGEAVLLALDSFRTEQTQQKIIVIFSDGEDHSATLDAALLAAQADGVVIHTLGYGTADGTSIPIRNSAGLVVGNQQDRTGNVVITRLEDGTMRTISAETGGLYQPFDAGGVALRNVATLINSGQSATFGSQSRMLRVERFVLFVILALLALSFEILLPETRS